MIKHFCDICGKELTLKVACKFQCIPPAPDFPISNELQDEREIELCPVCCGGLAEYIKNRKVGFIPYYIYGEDFERIVKEIENDQS